MHGVLNMNWNKRRRMMQDEQPRDKAAVRYAPREMLLPREIDRFLERAWIPWKATRRWRRPWLPDEWMPDTDVFEREGKVVVRADLPGIKREDLEVRVEGGDAHCQRSPRGGEGDPGEGLPPLRAADRRLLADGGAPRRFQRGCHRGHVQRRRPRSSYPETSGCGFTAGRHTGQVD
jgi:HSP20 family molecular chaperone IbpA